MSRNYRKQRQEVARGLSGDFLSAMREKLESGRLKGNGWWDCQDNERKRQLEGIYGNLIKGHKGNLVHHLFDEIVELVMAIESRDKTEIRAEAADVANLAMMIAAAEGALDN